MSQSKLKLLSFIVFLHWLARAGRLDCKLSKSYKLWPAESQQVFASFNPFASTSQQAQQQQIHQQLAEFLGPRYQQPGGFDERDDEETGEWQHKEAKVEHVEGKEIGFMYPVLLALLILGALFIPFISLFFFLAVSAFNCNSLGGAGFGQVTPVFGRRRRRRKRHLADQSPDATGAKNSTTSRRDGQHPVSLGSSLVQSLPALMLFDAVEDFAESGDYGFWRKQLARNTLRLQDALAEFADGAWLSLLGEPSGAFGQQTEDAEHDEEDEDHLAGSVSNS